MRYSARMTDVSNRTVTPKVPCRTPAKGRDGVTNVPLWKFDTVRSAILDAVASAGSGGLPFSALPAAVSDRLSDADARDLGSLGWHVTTVKLELECRGELQRMKGISPQRLHIP